MFAIKGTAVGGTPSNPTLSIEDGAGNEGDGTAFTVTLSEAAATEVTATWTASIESGDTAVAADLGSTTGTVTIVANGTTGTFTVPTAGDSTDEHDETFTVTLSDPSNAELASDPTATGTITDDDDPPTLSVADNSVSEASGLVTFVVTPSPPSGKTVTVTWTASAESGDTATSPADFEASSGTLTINPEDLTVSFTVRTVNDSIVEPDETFTVTLSSATNATISDATAKGTITNDDAASMDATLSGLTVTAGGSDLATFVSGTTSYTASVANTVAEVTVTPTTTDDGATIEYLDESDMTLADAGTAAGHQVTLAEGDNVITVRVTAEDGTTEMDYTVTVNRAAADTTAPTLESADVIIAGTYIQLSFNEGLDLTAGELSTTVAGAFSLTVDGGGQEIDSVSRAGFGAAGSNLLYVYPSSTIYSGQTVVVSYDKSEAGTDAIADGAGNEVADFATGSGGVPEVKNASRETPPPSTDATLSGLTVTAGGSDLVTFASGTTSYTASVANDVETVTFTETKNDADASVAYLDSDGNTLDDAGTAAGHQVTLAEGDNVITVRVMAEDGTTELDYTVTVNRAAAEMTPVVTIAPDKSTVIEDEGAADFTLSRTEPTAAALTVTVEVTQQADRDLLPDGAAAERTVTFAVGSATAALSVTLDDDELKETNGKLTVEVQAGAGYTVGDPASATVTVGDADTGRPTPANLMASPGAGVGEVVLSWDAHAPHLIFDRHQYRYKTDGDYLDVWTDIPNSGQFSNLEGDGSNLTGYTVTGLVGGQVHSFQVRTFNLMNATTPAYASDPSNEEMATPRSAAVSFGAGSYSVDEGGTVEVTVQLDAAPGREVVVPVSAAGVGGATAPGETGADWSGVPENVTFGATDTAMTFTLAATQDTVDDDGESVALSFGTLPDGVTAGSPSEATVTITDDDAAAALPTLSVAGASAAEGSAVTFTVTLSAAATADVTATWTASIESGDTASAADFTDLSAATGMVTVTANQTTATITVATAQDTTDEPDETFTLTLSSPSNAALGDATATGTIVDDDEAATPPDAPTGFTATVGNAEVALAWDAPQPDSGVTRHEYRYKTTGDYPMTWTGIANSAVGGENQAGFTVTMLTNEVAHTFELRAVSAGGNSEEEEAGPVTPTPGICDRTQIVHEIIVYYATGVDNCAAVTVADLAVFTALDMSTENIASLKAADFAGLTNLLNLSLGFNSFTTLPPNVFSGLTALTHLYLNDARLSSLPDGVFSGLSALTQLNLDDNALSSLDAGVFTGLSALTTLDLDGNVLSSLDAGVFTGLSALEILQLQGNMLSLLPGTVFSSLTSLTELVLKGNVLSSLDAGVFTGLSALEILQLQGNMLSLLPGTVFSGLTALQAIDLSDNALNALPERLFSGLTALRGLDLSGNPTSPLPLTVTVEKVGTDQVRAKVLAGAPFAVNIPVTVVNGTLDGGATTLRVAAGSVDGTPVTLNRTPGTTTSVDIDLTTQPKLPTKHTGYAFASSRSDLSAPPPSCPLAAR